MAEPERRRAITRTEFDQLRADIAQCLRILRRLDGTAAAPVVQHDDQRGIFLPGTGWVQNR